MNPIKLKIKTNSHNYSIIIGPNLLPKIYNIIKNNSINFNKCLFVIDKKVPKKFVNQIKKSLKRKKIYFHFITSNEKNKDKVTVDKILEILLSKNFSREDCLITIGGGITGDIGGFAASIFKRGLKFINIPTTLLSQVDSSVGGKTGINSKYGKNQIGSFYQPKLVVSDSLLLQSLPRREILCGYGEILKHALISNKKFFKFLDTNINKILKLKSPYLEKAIFESCKIKKIIVEKDEKEKNLRKILNFGHTFAHSYEASLNFSKKLNHGEAVLLGMNSALNFSFKNKKINIKEFYSIKNHLKKINFQINLKNYFSTKDINKIISFMQKDKKNTAENINLVLLKKIGQVSLDKVYTKKILNKFFKSELINKYL
tara:strand:- start:577 stop:1692 length:1116 start_codon:yes stop_codon:yes gene_type:complete